MKVHTPLSLILMIACIVALVGLALLAYTYNGEIKGFYLLCGAIGVVFFLLATNVLSLIQKEGRYDD